VLTAQVELKFLKPTKNKRSNKRETLLFIRSHTSTRQTCSVASIGNPKAKKVIGQNVAGLIYGVKQLKK